MNKVFIILFYRYLIELVKCSLHTGQRFGSNKFTQSLHKILWPHGMNACILSASMHMIHFES